MSRSSPPTSIRQPFTGTWERSLSPWFFLVVCIFVLRVTTKIAVDYDTPPPAVRQEMGTAYDALPPEPRLQGVPGHPEDPQADLRNKIAADEKANETTGWIDQNTGVAQIPVSEAMKIIAEKGLPGASAAAEKK